MNIKKEWPPNINELRSYFDFDGFKPVFAWGSILYNPSGDEIPIDLELHEAVHSQQQKQFSSVEFWWKKYVLDRVFRLEMELEAYSKQLEFIKKHTNAKIAKQALEDFSTTLSSKLYNLDLTKERSSTLIRLWSK